MKGNEMKGIIYASGFVLDRAASPSKRNEGENDNEFRERSISENVHLMAEYLQDCSRIEPIIHQVMRLAREQNLDERETLVMLSYHLLKSTQTLRQQIYEMSMTCKP